MRGLERESLVEVEKQVFCFSGRGERRPHDSEKRKTQIVPESVWQPSLESMKSA
jgi:hypothetical protein